MLCKVAQYIQEHDIDSQKKTEEKEVDFEFEGELPF